MDTDCDSHHESYESPRSIFGDWGEPGLTFEANNLIGELWRLAGEEEFLGFPTNTGGEWGNWRYDWGDWGYFRRLLDSRSIDGDF